MNFLETFLTVFSLLLIVTIFSGIAFRIWQAKQTGRKLIEDEPEERKVDLWV